MTQGRESQIVPGAKIPQKNIYILHHIAPLLATVRHGHLLPAYILYPSTFATKKNSCAKIWNILNFKVMYINLVRPLAATATIPPMIYGRGWRCQTRDHLVWCFSRQPLRNILFKFGGPDGGFGGGVGIQEADYTYIRRRKRAMAFWKWESGAASDVC